MNVHEPKPIKRSQMRRDQSCSGKYAYLTKAHAKHDARELRRKLKHKISVYKCRFCPHWHVGHTPAYLRKER